MASEDGSVIIKIDADDKDAEKKLNRLSEKIEKTEDSLSQKKDTQSSIKAKLDAAEKAAYETEVKVERLKSEIAELQAIGDMAGIKHPIGLAEAQASLKEQEKILKRQNSEADRLNSQYEKLTNEINVGTSSLEQMKAEAGELVQRLTQSPGIMDRMDEASKRVEKTMGNLKNRLMSTLKSALVFSVLYKGLSLFRDYLGRTLSTSKEFTDATAQLKWNLLAAFQPIWDVIIPALTVLVRLLSTAAAALARFFALLSGRSLSDVKASTKAMNDEAKAIGGAGGAADDAEKSLAAFDEINKLSDSSDAGGGGGAAAEPINMDALDGVDEKMQNILDLVLAIAAGLLTWKIAKHFGADMQTAIGLAITMGGAVYYIEGFFDAWNNGLDGGNLAQMIIGLGAAMIGLTIIAGPMAAMIGLVVGSIGLLAVGLHDIASSGTVTAENLASVETGIIGIGVALSFLTKSPIPLVLGALAGLVVGFALTGEHSEEAILGIQNVCEGFAKFMDEDFKGGISQVWEGIKGIFSAGFKTISDKFTEWDNKITKKVLDWTNEIVESISNKWNTFKENASVAWNGFWDAVANGFKTFINNIMEGIENMLNWIIDGINSISIGAPDWVPVIGGKSWSPSLPRAELPRLATGAVIPPNREFLAVLGDQKSGTNIETPLPLMVQAFKQALAESGYNGRNEAVLVLDGVQFGKMVYKYNNRESNRIGVSLVT